MWTVHGATGKVYVVMKKGNKRLLLKSHRAHEESMSCIPSYMYVGIPFLRENKHHLALSLALECCKIQSDIFTCKALKLF